MSTAKSDGKPEQIDLTKLNLQQLQQLKMEFESVNDSFTCFFVLLRLC